MNDEFKKCCDRLQGEAKIAESCLARVGQHLISPELTSTADWKTLLQEAATQCSAKREPARQAGQRVKVWMEEEAILKAFTTRKTVFHPARYRQCS